MSSSSVDEISSEMVSSGELSDMCSDGIGNCDDVQTRDSAVQLNTGETDDEFKSQVPDDEENMRLIDNKSNESKQEITNKVEEDLSTVDPFGTPSEVSDDHQNTKDCDKLSEERLSLYENSNEIQSPSEDFKIPISTDYTKSSPRDISSSYPYKMLPDESSFLNHHSSNSVAQSPLHSPHSNNLSAAVFHNTQMPSSHPFHNAPPHHLFGGASSNAISQSHGLGCHSSTNPYLNAPPHSFSSAEHWFWEQHRQNQQAALVWPPTEGVQHKGGGGGGGAVVGCGGAPGIVEGVNGGGGGGGGNPTQQQAPQNLMHWMSFMAEHMNNPHHETAPHYMWNGVDSKMGAINHDHQGSPSPMQKVRGYYANMSRPPFNPCPPNHLDDRLDHRNGNPPNNGQNQQNNANGGNTATSNAGGVLGDLSLSQHMGHAGIYPRSNGSASSSSPPAVSTPSSMLIVPQPISAVKMPPTPPGISHNQPNGGSTRKYQCKMCPQIFGSKADLQLHTQIHMREAKPYKCSQCPKAFANSSYLSQHTRIHLGIKPYRCDICQRKFTQLSHLQQHIRTHTGDKPYKCRHPGCNKAFSQLSNLQSHSRCHQTDKPYKCNSCYKCFMDEASLLEHIPKHKESKHLKTHICQYCGKSYTQETYLQKHMQKHAERTDKRPPLNNGGGGGVPGLRQEHQYWPKHENTALDHIDARMTGDPCQQNNIDHSRQLTASVHRDPMEHQPRMDDLRQTHTPAHMGGNMTYDALGTKTTSAFTPIQTSMLPIGGSTQLSMAATTSQRYFPYDCFPKPHTQVPTMDVKPHQFPNNLISLDHIRNYSAHQPTMTSNLLLKDKGIAQ